jgi:hypothetical protein
VIKMILKDNIIQLGLLCLHIQRTFELSANLTGLEELLSGILEYVIL